ncbi:MAG: hypothetical protein M3O46_02780 [Myxococcota bacterium]|nr:hypothetical protein [Myxococcota bacterium]
MTEITGRSISGFGRGAPTRHARYVVTALTACTGATLHLGRNVPTDTVTVGASADYAAGVNGRLEEATSTSFQPADWQYRFFDVHPDPSALDDLHAQHILIQLIDGGAVPWKSNSQQPSDWDFTELDAIVQHVLAVGDGSPELQVAVAPRVALNQDGSINLPMFAKYCEYLVRYYNGGGFDWGGKHFASSSAQPIRWWGIFNEYNVHQLTDGQYVQLYDAVVPAMRAVDSTIKLSAFEFTDFNYSMDGDPTTHLPTFLAAVTEPVDVVSVHFYSTSHYTDPDAKVFDTVRQFAVDLAYFRQQLSKRPDAAVWVTQNNVNSDYPLIDGTSANNRDQRFVPDTRGTSAFFASWRPYVFSLLGKAGNRALYHWEYTAGHCSVNTSNCQALDPPTDTDTQNGEVNFVTGKKYLSYWVDYWLARMFPVTPASPGPEILQLNRPPTESSGVEVLATRDGAGAVVVMMVNRAVRDAGDRDGHGEPRGVFIDVSALGPFSSASEVTVDENTDLTNGPIPVPISVAQKFPVTLGGYGVVFLKLTP